MAAELWVMNILKIVVAVIAVHLTLTKIIPLIQDFLMPYVDKKATDAFTSLLGVIIIVIGGSAIVSFIIAIGDSTIGYLGVIGAGFDVVLKFFEYIQYGLIAVLAFAVLKNWKK